MDNKPANSYGITANVSSRWEIFHGGRLIFERPLCLKNYECQFNATTKESKYCLKNATQNNLKKNHLNYNEEENIFL